MRAVMRPLVLGRQDRSLAQRRVRWAAAWALGACFAVVLSACGPDNVQTCMQECEDVNALPCTEDDYLDCEAQCPASWNERGLDYTEYLECRFGQYGCDDDGAFVYTQTNCDLP